MRSSETSDVVVDLLPVPTLLELQRERPDLVKIVGRSAKDGTPNRFMLTPEGSAHLGQIMRENGRRAAAAEAKRPPIVSQPQKTPAQIAYEWARDNFDTLAD